MKRDKEVRIIRDMAYMNSLFNNNIGVVFTGLFFVFVVSIFLAIVLAGN